MEKTLKTFLIFKVRFKFMINIRNYVYTGNNDCFIKLCIYIPLN